MHKSKPPGATVAFGTGALRACIWHAGSYIFGHDSHTHSIHTRCTDEHGQQLYIPADKTDSRGSRALVARRSTYRASCLSSERSMSLVRTCSHTSTLGRSHTTLGTLSWPITSHKLIDCACLQLAVGDRWEGSAAPDIGAAPDGSRAVCPLPGWAGTLAHDSETLARKSGVS